MISQKVSGLSGSIVRNMVHFECTGICKKKWNNDTIYGHTSYNFEDIQDKYYCNPRKTCLPLNRPSAAGLTWVWKETTIKKAPSTTNNTIQKTEQTKFAGKKESMKREDCRIRKLDLTSWWDTDHPPALSPNIVTWVSTSKAKSKLIVQLQLLLLLLLLQSFFEEGPVRGRRQRDGYFPEPIQGQLPGPSIPVNDFLFQMHQLRLTLWN